MRALSRDLPPPPLQLDAPLEFYPSATPAGAEPEAACGVDAGSTVRCSYELCLVSGGGASGVATEVTTETTFKAAQETAAKVLLEKQQNLDVLLGSGLLHPHVESLLAEAARTYDPGAHTSTARV